MHRAQGSGVSVGMLEQLKSLWSARKLGDGRSDQQTAKKLSLQVVSAKRSSTLEFRLSRVPRLRLSWISAIQFAKPCQPLRPYDSDGEMHA